MKSYSFSLQEQEPSCREFRYAPFTQPALARAGQSMCVGDFVQTSRVKNTLETAFRFLHFWFNRQLLKK
jgi:hypothetical protein